MVLCVFSHFFLNFLNEPFYLNGNIYGSLETIFFHPGVVRINFQKFPEVCGVCILQFFLNFFNEPFHLSGNIHGSLENIFLHAGVVRIHF